MSYPHRPFAIVSALFLVIAACGPRGPQAPRPEAATPMHASAAAPSPIAPPPTPGVPDDAIAGPTVAPSEDPACPPGMTLVDGESCTEVRQDCVEWMDPPSAVARCARFAPSVCVGERRHQRFCIDTDERTPPGEALPQGDVSWATAKATCEQEGKRLCRETEWQFACEGEAMLPYPYGYERDASRCNFDRGDLTDPHTGKLKDYRQPSAELTRCTSPFGVRNLTGNIDEWVYRDFTWGQWRSALKGGWWMAARNRCRPATTAHDEAYHDIQTGFRCCAEARPAASQEK